MSQRVRSSSGLGIGGPRRWHQQRWLIDNVIRSVGIDFDHARTVSYAAVCGPESNADFASIRQRVTKFADISPAFEAAARRREERARAAAEAQEKITARHNFFMAAVHWAVAQWPIVENDEQNLFYNQRKRECYSRYAALADHRVEAAWIPVAGKALPGWFHLPPGYTEGRVPAVVSFPGMDGFKEGSVAMYGDRWLQRGIAVLALEGPGQYESAVLGIPVSVSMWNEVGSAVVEWFRGRSEIDPEQIALIGSDFGCFFGVLAASREPRFRACAVNVACFEPGFRTIFEEATPTYKRRFMYMSGIADEDEFDAFCETLTWEPYVSSLRMPFLCTAGEADEVSPLIYTDRFMESLRSPKQLVVYQDARHGIGDAPSANLGPAFQILAADWIAARFAGKSFPSERWFVESSGRVSKRGYDLSG